MRKRRVPVALSVGLLVLGTTSFYAYVGQLVPQKTIPPPDDPDIPSGATAIELVSYGEEIASGAGLCMTCHTIGQSGPLRFPDLAGIGSLAGERVPGLSDVEYLAQSLYDPDAYIVEGFNPGMPPIHKAPIGLDDRQILAVVAWLQSLGGTPTVTLESRLNASSDPL